MPNVVALRSIDLRPARRYADSEPEKDQWIGAIGRSIVRFSASYRPPTGARDEYDDDDDDIE